MRQTEIRAPEGPRWNAQQTPEARLLLLERSKGIAAKLLSSTPTEQKEFLIDTRSVHRELFADLVPAGFAEYAGFYRGSNVPSLKTRRVAIRYGKSFVGSRFERTVPPYLVPERMEMISNYIDETVSIEIPRELYLNRMSKIFFMINDIHPYLDGNGHISRLVLLILASRQELKVSPMWTIFPRPYTAAMGLCLQAYRRHPDLLVSYLGRWFQIQK
jgi:fido (protein-threonine AMPylation protein)